MFLSPCKCLCFWKIKQSLCCFFLTSARSNLELLLYSDAVYVDVIESGFLSSPLIFSSYILSVLPSMKIKNDSETVRS